jgi:hypothetical protein
MNKKARALFLLALALFISACSKEKPAAYNPVDEVMDGLQLGMSVAEAMLVYPQMHENAPPLDIYPNYPQNLRFFTAENIEMLGKNGDFVLAFLDDALQSVDFTFFWDQTGSEDPAIKEHAQKWHGDMVKSVTEIYGDPTRTFDNVGGIIVGWEKEISIGVGVYESNSSSFAITAADFVLLPFS